MILKRCITTNTGIFKRKLCKLNNTVIFSIRKYLDEKNPYNVELSGCYKRTYAYHSMIERVPAKVKQIIDNIVEDRDAIVQKYGDNAKEEIKEIINCLNQFKCEIEANQEFKIFNTSCPDKDMWNASILELGKRNKYLSSVWLFSECYIYRRIREIFLKQSILKCYDYFQKEKEYALTSQFSPMATIAGHIEQNRALLKTHPEKLEKYFENLIKLELWGNQLDLSSTLTQAEAPKDPIATIIKYDHSILVNNIKNIWQCVSDPSIDHSQTMVDIVCDNVGYELFIDLCMGDFLLENYLTKCVRFHVKLVPFFISDVMPADFLWTLRMLANHTDEKISKIGQRCTSYLCDGRFRLMDKEYFWTTGYCYNRMKEIDQALYKSLSEAQIIIFKGDVNYRKLVGEVNWEPTTPFKNALRGFMPSNVSTLRTVKSELISGLEKGVAQQLDQRDSNWMISGEYGVIQFAGK